MLTMESEEEEEEEEECGRRRNGYILTGARRELVRGAGADPRRVDMTDKPLSSRQLIADMTAVVGR